MRILIFSDLHLHNWQYGANYSTGWNSRLLSQEKVLDDITYHVAHNDIEHVVFCGDFFHTHGKITADVLAVASAFFSNITQHAQIFVLVGNHDMADRSSRVTAVDWLIRQPKICVVRSPIQVNVKGIPFCMAPYLEDKIELKKVLDKAPKDALIFLHQGVRGIPIGSDFVVPNEIFEAVMVNPYENPMVFTGHYHQHEIINENLTIVGATMQHTWSDSEARRGYLEYDTDTRGIQFWDSDAPQFIKIEVGDRLRIPSNEFNSGDFLKLTGIPDNTDALDIKENCLDNGAASVEIEGHTADRDTKVFSITHQFDLDNVIKEYQRIKRFDSPTIATGLSIREGNYETPVSDSE